MNKNENARSFIAFQVLLLVFTLLFPSFLTPPSPLGKCIVKTFLYDIDPTYPPVDGLNVELWDSAPAFIASDLTDASGQVTFIGLPDGTYTLKWVWGGAGDSETIMVDSTKIVWELTNYLEPKSGGGQHSAESARQALAGSQRGTIKMKPRLREVWSFHMKVRHWSLFIGFGVVSTTEKAK